MAVTGAPSVERELGLSHAAYLLFAFAAPLLLAALLEAAVALVSDVADRRRLVLAGQAALAGSLLLVASSTSGVGLTLGLAAAGASSGVACGAAQALLVESDPRGADRAMLLWTVFAAVGDLLTPVLTGTAIALGFSFRGAMLATAVVVAIQCAGLAYGARRPEPRRREPPVDGEQAVDPIRAALARAVRRPRLWIWLFAAASCTLLDELVIALAALRMHGEQGVSEPWAAAAAVTFAAGGMLGAALADRVVARAGRRAVLLASSALCVIALAGVIGPRSAIASCVALFVTGVACAPHHALAQARAYDEMPGNPGTVQAVAQLFVIVDVVAPIAIGVVADRLGLRAALGSLALQPLVVGVCALFWGGAPADAEWRHS